MEMDIPDADELQWLEANSHYQDFPDDEEFDLEPYPYPPEAEESARLPQSDPSASSPTHPVAESGKKRPQSPLELSISSDDEPSDPKRSRSGFAEESEEDDDLLIRFGLDSGDVDLRVTEEDEVEETEKYLSQFASEIDGDCISVTGPSGQRVYAKLDKVEKADEVKKFTTSSERGGLLAEPISNLLRRLEQQSLMKALQASSEAQDETLLYEELVPVDNLWVDKYAPKSFTELLSDEHTNREVLLWLKQWDSTVFGGDIRNTSDDVLQALRRHSSISHHPKRSDTNFARKNRDFRSSEKSFGSSFTSNQDNARSLGTQGAQSKKLRNGGAPDQKVLLLCGPPGLGKTTLAHVAAKHCGYNVVEINASDDRSSSTIETKILDAVQMNSVLADSRPNCLVIDEIDGALGDGKGAVEVILKMVAADRKSESIKEISSEEQQQSGRKSSKRGRRAVSLSRPVICICNDLYAAALRPLRQVAKVHMFTQPTLNRVVSRLKYICNKEGMKTSSVALTELAGCTECDIRSCLNTLQFLNKKREPLNLLDISSQVIGRKDMTKSVFDIWTEVFQKKKVKGNRRPDSRQTTMLDAPDSLYSLISHRGDYDLIFDGIHENMLRQRYHDPGMLKTVQCLDNLGISDLVHQRVMSSHNMSFYAYHPPLAITIRNQLCQVGKPVIEWPRSFQRYRTSSMEKRETLRSWRSKIAPNISRHMSSRSFIEDTLSLLMHILSPLTLRPIALHLLSDAERNDLSQLVSTMVAYSISYKNAKTESLPNDMRPEGMADMSVLTFDPPIEGFLRFKGYRSGHHQLTSAVKQLLIHEVEKQKILKESSNRSAGKSGDGGLRMSTNGTRTSEPAREFGLLKEGNHNAEQARKNSQKAVCAPSIPNGSLSGGSTTSTSVMKHKVVGVSKKARSFDFFGRFKKSSGNGSDNGSDNGDGPVKNQATLERDCRPVLFKFNEGFTNAVKRPVRVREFLW